ncbi:15214_t:CDS:2, partial [Rhizophagus irregularis]
VGEKDYENLVYGKAVDALVKGPTKLLLKIIAIAHNKEVSTFSRSSEDLLDRIVILTSISMLKVMFMS